MEQKQFLSSMHCVDLPPSSETSTMTVSGLMADLRLKGDNGETKQDEIVVRSTTVVDSEVKNRSRLLNIPFDVLENIMKFCVGIEYLNFRATCKLCRLAAPAKIQWSNERMRLQSPWLMALDKKRGIMTFTDPMFGDNKYLIKASPELFYGDGEILCSRYGWLLLFLEDDCLAFFNPFTSDIRKLPHSNHHESACFSAPPTSTDCMVVGFSPWDPWNLYIHFVAGEPKWRRFKLNFYGDGARSFRFPTFSGGDVYAMLKDGGLQVFEDIADFVNLSVEVIIHEAPGGPRSSSTEYFQSKCDQDHFLVIVGGFGESVEVFKLNVSTEKWEKIDSLGKHMIYICDRTCVCMDAKTPEMGNKIYFPRLSCENKKIVFYSMETRMYHTFNGRNVEQNNLNDLRGTKRRTLYNKAWIKPNWS